jgi:hypothetical protein
MKDYSGSGYKSKQAKNLDPTGLDADTDIA